MSRANGKFSRREFNQSAMDGMRNDKAPTPNPQPWPGEVSGNVDGMLTAPDVSGKLKGLQGTIFTPKGG